MTTTDGGSTNVGILCDGLCAIDIDVDQEDVAQEIKSQLLTALGPACVKYRSNSRRSTLIYATQGIFTTRTLKGLAYTDTDPFDGTPNGQNIQLLGNGSQTVVYGIHPTNVPILLERPDLLDRDRMVVLSETALRRALGGVAPLIGAKVGDVSALFGLTIGPLAQPERRFITEQRSLRAVDPNLLEVAISQANNTTDYETYIRWLCAIDAAFCDDRERGQKVAFEFASRWSVPGKVFDPDAHRQKWEELSGTPHAIGAPWLVRQLAAQGIDMSEYNNSAAQADFSKPPVVTACAVEPGVPNDARDDLTDQMFGCEPSLGNSRERVGEIKNPGLEQRRDTQVRVIPETIFDARNESAALYTDDDLASRFVRGPGQQFQFVSESNRWISWDGTCWNRRQRLRIRREIRECLRVIWRGAPRKSCPAGVLNSQQIDSVEKLVRAELECPSARFDADPMILNCPGGIVDLATGELMKHDPNRYCARIAGATPRGNCPRWLKFIDEISEKDSTVARYLQRLCGYLLTGSTREQKFYFIYGPGSNGKSVFLAILAAVLGEFATTSMASTFMKTKNEQHPTHLAALDGMRGVFVPETDSESSWADGLIKTITGAGESKIAARVMRGDVFEYVPRFKLILSGNHKPKLTKVTDGMRRRLEIIGFRFRPHVVDKNLEKALRAELDGILLWCVEGCLEWQLLGGLYPPKSVVDETTDYFLSQDAFSLWISEQCECSPDAFSGLRELFANFASWNTGRCGAPWSESEFAERLGAEFKHDRSRRGSTPSEQGGPNPARRGYWGIKLRSKDPGTTSCDFDVVNIGVTRRPT